MRLHIGKRLAHHFSRRLIGMQKCGNLRCAFCEFPVRADDDLDGRKRDRRVVFGVGIEGGPGIVRIGRFLQLHQVEGAEHPCRAPVIGEDRLAALIGRCDGGRECRAGAGAKIRVIGLKPIAFELARALLLARPAENAIVEAALAGHLRVAE